MATYDNKTPSQGKDVISVQGSDVGTTDVARDPAHSAMNPVPFIDISKGSNGNTPQHTDDGQGDKVQSSTL